MRGNAASIFARKLSMLRPAKRFNAAFRSAMNFQFDVTLPASEQSRMSKAET
jgi:hypothetical protein